jgi:gluconolactonase
MNSLSGIKLNPAIMKTFLTAVLLVLLLSCGHGKQFGSIERIDPDFDLIVNQNAKIEIIADGMDWSEGPLWVDSLKMLLFSDVPANTIYKWTEKNGKEIYLTPSGYTDTIKRGGETGSNGLLLSNSGRLILCQHGNRQIAEMESDLAHPLPNFKTIADTFQGKRFNSPNDACIRKNGDIFFTDPPYGLERNMQDSLKEIPFQGVYLVKPDGKVKLLLDSITRPNGIALTPDEKTLIVANSDKNRLRWYAYDIRNDSLTRGRIFYDATAVAGTQPGSADGLKIDKNGNIFATGPGGVWVFDRKGRVLGRFKIPEATSNVAMSADQKTIFVTADMYVLRIRLR